MDYFKKLDTNLYQDMYWNLPETRHQSVNVIGGNLQNFQTVVKTAEFLSSHYPVEQIKVVLPDALQKTLPPMPYFVFLPSTDTGSFNGHLLDETMNQTDYNLLVGDFSKNSITGKNLSRALQNTTKPTLITRDAIDLLTNFEPDNLLMNQNINFLASAPQVQKLLQAVYYPKILTLSQPLLQVAETLHKFTLSYSVGLVLMMNNQIIVAKGGEVQSTTLENSEYTPLSVWNGEFAARIVGINLFNPNNFIPATIAAIFPQTTQY